MDTPALLEHRIHLYANAEPVTRPPGTELPLRVELLPHGDLQKLMLLVSIMFAIPGLPALRWNETAAWLDIPLLLATPVFRGCSEFIAALPELESWMAAWRLSEGRQPQLAPDWARRNAIGSETVAEVADGIRNLASADETVLRFCDPAGNEQRLSVPARACLSLPRTPTRGPDVLVVKAVQRVQVYVSETGTPFGVIATASDAAQPVYPTLNVPPTDIKPTRMIRVANPRLMGENE